MATVSNYMFYDLSRIGDDQCSISGRDQQNNEFGTYTTTNAGDLFKASGTWEWAGESAEVVNLDDGKVVNINSLTTSKFVFSFTKSDGPVRAGLAGNYVITVEK